MSGWTKGWRSLSKRNSKNERRPRDFYPTPESAVLPLLPWLNEGTKFAEPCAGECDLIHHLEKHGHECRWASDIEPRSERNYDAQIDAFDLKSDYIEDSDYIITNPPWDRKILHPMIEHFRKLRPTWLLLDADWMHTKQARPYLQYCSMIVSVGRVKWIPDSPHVGFDNAAWYLFNHQENWLDGCRFINVDLETIK